MPHIPDPSRSRMLRLTALCTAAYFVSYISRINYGAVLVEMVEATGFSKTQLSMAVTGAFQQGSIGVMLTGSNPTPSYAAQLMVNHVEDYGFIRYEMGYAAAVSVALLALIYAFSFVARKLFEEKD